MKNSNSNSEFNKKFNRKYTSVFNSIINSLLIIGMLGFITFANAQDEYQEKSKFEFLEFSPTEENQEKYFEFLSNNLGNQEGFIALQRITETFLKAKDYEGAISMYEEYKADFPQHTKKIDKIIEILKIPLDNIIETNLGSGINNAASDYSPVPTADDSRIYFTSIDRDEYNETEDIYFSDFIDDIWTPAQKLTDISTEDQGEAPQSITTDGTQLVLFGSFEQNLGKGDLYYSKREIGRWGKAELFPEPINSKYFDCDGKITSDGKAMIFVSDRPGGIGEFHEFGQYFNGGRHGNTDIYVSIKTDSGWSKPINLGAKINTPFAERKPFLHPDGKSLYFSSDGHPGLGRLDLFKVTKLKEDSWTEWSEPINLGKEINSGKNDRGAIVATSGDLAYFATADRDLTFGGSDIFKMDVPSRFRPDPVTTLSGRVLDNKGNILTAKIVWEDLETGKRLGEMQSNPDDGKYFIILPHGKNYGVYAEKEGYFPISKNIDLRKTKDPQKFKEDIILYSISDLVGDDLELMGSGDLTYDSFELGEKKLIQMNNLFFEYNKADLLKSSFPELDRVVYLLKNYPIDLVEVAGHTDSVGNEQYNLTLSDKRSNAVREYLIKKGISKDKLLAKGYGKTEPIATNETEEGRKKNRRVELKILKISRVRK